MNRDIHDDLKRLVIKTLHQRDDEILSLYDLTDKVREDPEFNYSGMKDLEIVKAIHDLTCSCEIEMTKDMRFKVRVK